MKKILLIMTVLSLFGVSGVAAQDLTVSGRITSTEDGSSLPGVNVLLKGTSTGTVTDIDGAYSISVPAGSAESGTLVFSFIGLATQEVPIGGRTTIDVQMGPDVTQLSEVVVTAVGIERERKALGYSTTSLSSQDVALKAETDPIRALSGKVPGVNITGSGGLAGGSTNIVIRGNSSFLNNNQPLFVVDGIPFDNSTVRSTSFINGNQFSNRAIDLDPNNIESITVLKGGAASVLYGARAANGVIVVTTKAGKKGVQKGLEITFNNSYSMEEPANLPEYQKKYGQGGEFSYNGGFVGNWGPAFSEVDEVPHPYWEPSNAGNAGLPEAFPELVGKMIPYKFHDNLNNFFRTGHLFETAVQVTSGVGNANITGGISRSVNESYIPGSEFERTSVNFGGNAQLSNKFFVNGNVNYVRTNQTSPQAGISADFTTSATSLFQRLLFIPTSFDLMGSPYIHPVTNGSVYFRTDQDNPRWLVETSPYTSNVNRVYGHFTLGADIAEGLQVSYKAGFNSWTDARRNVLAKGSRIAQSGSMYTANVSNEELDGTLLINYNRDLNESITLSANVGQNINQRTYTELHYSGSNLTLFGQNTMTNSVNQIVNTDYYSRRRLIGVFADVTVGYNDWAFLTVAGRNDWSSTLGIENRSFFYPSVSGSVILSEALDIASNALSSLKLRASFAETGNDAPVYYTGNVLVQNPWFGFNDTDVQFPFRNVPGLSVSNSYGNPALVAEKTKDFEVGVEAGFLNGRIHVDATFYNRKSIDQISRAASAPSTGVEQVVVNSGSVTNKGIELGLTLVPVRLTNGFEWEVFGNFTRNRSNIDDLGPLLGESMIVGGFSNGVSIRHVPGMPYGVLYGSEAIRDSQGRYLINPETGLTVVSNYLTVIGDPNPDFILGIGNTFRFKGLQLSALLEWKQGGDIYSNQVGNMIGRGLLKYTEDREWARVIPGVLVDPSVAQTYGEAMQMVNKGTAISDLTADQQAAIEAVDAAPVNNLQISANESHFSDGFGNYGADDVNVYDGTVIRLREISLGYSLPRTILERTPFGRVTISLSGRNLWFNAPNFPEGSNYDPEVSTMGAGNSQGIDLGGALAARRYGVNLSVTF